MDGECAVNETEIGAKSGVAGSGSIPLKSKSCATE